MKLLGPLHQIRSGTEDNVIDVRVFEFSSAQSRGVPSRAEQLGLGRRRDLHPIARRE